MLQNYVDIMGYPTFFGFLPKEFSENSTHPFINPLLLPLQEYPPALILPPAYSEPLPPRYF